MSEQFEARGGARVGWVNASWPFAKLTASPDSLRVWVGVIGDYTFSPDQVTSITRYTSIPVLGWGIQIHHDIPEYPERLIFWTLGNPDALLARIHEAGFRPQGMATTTKTEAPQQRQGLPFRWGPVVGIVAVWNVLMILDALWGGLRPAPGPLALVAVGVVFASALAVLRLPVAQRIILKPGRNLGEIRPMLKLLLLVSGPMSSGSR